MRNSCRLCGNRLFSDSLLELKRMPKAAQFYPKKAEIPFDKGVDLRVYQCQYCGLVQLNINPVSYFKEVITAASFSEKARQTRFGQMSDFVEKYSLKGKKVLEVGSGLGHMLDVLKDAGFSEAVGLEASSKSVETGAASGRRMLKGHILDRARIKGGPFDAFISLNYIEHQPFPGKVIRSVYENSSPGAMGFVTVPNLEYLLKTKCFYEFVADHLSYFTKKTLSYAFESNGFDVLECFATNEENDIAVIVKKRESLSIASQYRQVESLINDLKRIVNDYSGRNKKVAVWGAGHRTLALLALSKLDNIEYVVDSAKFKQGKFTPVSHLNIVSPEQLTRVKVDLVIVMVPGIYPGEVLKALDQMHTGADIAVLRENKIEFIKHN